MKLMEVFERIGLVEIERDLRSLAVKDGPPMAAEAESQLREEEDWTQRDEQADTPAEATIPSAAAMIEESRSFDDIYAAAGIPESPFSADKLLKLLDALGTLPEQTRKQAVMAMDAAEENWTLEDPLLDARRRIQALEAERRRLDDQTLHTEARAEAELEAQREYEQRAVAQIRQQIADLEALMERELKKVAETCEHIKANGQSMRDACRREQARLDKEIDRLVQIEKLFMADIAESHSEEDNQSGA